MTATSPTVSACWSARWRGGWYLRGRLVGEPPQLYERIADGMAELEATMPGDGTRPLVEFYRRRDQIELWLPILP